MEKEFIYIQVDKNLKEQLKKEAKEINVTLSGYIKTIISNRDK